MEEVSPLCTATQRYRHNAILLRQARYPEVAEGEERNCVQQDPWRIEVDRNFKRPNVKLRKAQFKLTQSLRNNATAIRFYKHMGQVGRNSNVEKKSKTFIPQFNETGKSGGTPRGNKSSCSSLVAYSELNTSESSREKSEERVKDHTIPCGQLTKLKLKPFTSTTSIKQDPTYHIQRPKSSRVQGKKENLGAEKLPVQFERLSTGTVSEEIPNVNDADDSKRPRDLSRNTNRPGMAPERFIRPCCKFRSTTERCLTSAPSGVVPIQSCLDKAFFVVRDGTNGLLNSSQSHLIDGDNVVSGKRRPQSAPASAQSERFKQRTQNLRQHITDIMNTRGRLGLLFPKDRDMIYNKALAEIEKGNKDTALDSLYQKFLQKRIN